MMTDKCPVCSGNKMASVESLIIISNGCHPIGIYYEKK